MYWKSINWDFSHNTLVSAQDVAPFNCRKYHWFPGTFIPQIPFTLIEVLSLPDAMVLGSVFRNWNYFFPSAIAEAPTNRGGDLYCCSNYMPMYVAFI